MILYRGATGRRALLSTGAPRRDRPTKALTRLILARDRRLRKPCQESRRPKAAASAALMDSRTGRIVFGLFDRARIMYIPPMRRAGGRAALSLHIWLRVFPTLAWDGVANCHSKVLDIGSLPQLYFSMKSQACLVAWLSDPHFECSRVHSGQHWSKPPILYYC